MSRNDFLIAVSTIGHTMLSYGQGGLIVTVAHKSMPSVLLTTTGSVIWIEDRCHENLRNWKLVVHDGKGEGRHREDNLCDIDRKGGEKRARKTTLLTETDPERFLFEKYAEEKPYHFFGPYFYPSPTAAFTDSSLIIGYDAVEKRKAEILAETVDLAISKAQETIEFFKKL